MAFNSIIFIFAFLPVTLLLYHIVPGKVKNILLLAASFLFYAWGAFAATWALVGSIAVNYLCGLCLGARKTAKGRKACLIVGIIVNLGALIYFKYAFFGVSTWDTIFGFKIPADNIVVPLGLSFITFKAISYLMDIYRGEAPVAKNPLRVALYLAVFPEVLSGPIERYKAFSPQYAGRKVTLADFTYGIERFSIGLAKKVIIADILGKTADNIFSLSASQQANAGIAWLGVLCYTLQIFFDFAGYSDMAVGLGKMFGFTFMENFNFPYISKSITEFWRRWHISLSSWFRDYLYIPLGGNRTGNVYVNLIVVFFLSGLWHGAGWTFIIWGLWHGLFLLLERLCRNKAWYKHLPGAVRWAYTIFAIAIGWVMFRAGSLTAALQYYGAMFGIVKATTLSEYTFAYFANGKVIFTIVLGILLCSPIYKKLTARFEGKTSYAAVKMVAVNVLLIIGVIFVMNSTYSPFIYFQF